MSSDTKPMDEDSTSRSELVRSEREGFIIVRGKRSSSDDSERGEEEKRPAVKAATVIPEHEISSFVDNKKPRKRPNYLNHNDRCHIIKRIDRGEKQATLAREFGVTRAAVSQMNKKRDEILARGDFEGQSSSDRELGNTHTTSSHSQDESLSGEESESNKLCQSPTLEARSKTVAHLLKILQHPRPSLTSFQRAARRLTFILIEEVLSSFDTQVMEHENTSRSSQDTLFCGISLGTESASFESALCQIDATAQTGQIHVKLDQDDGCTTWKLQYLDVPDNITALEIMLFSTSGNGETECKALEALQSIGVQDHKISLVMVVCSSLGYTEISTRYPNVTIIVATINDKWTPGGGVHSESLSSLDLLQSRRRLGR